MVDITGFYDSLLHASFGGVNFNVLDTSQEVGRRVQRFLFPGLDAATYQDLGEDDGPIMLRGLLCGENYIEQMKSVQAVFYKAGPYQLVHPWLGSLQVMPVNGQRPQFRLSTNELNICRFELQLYRFVVPAPPQLDTLTKLESRLTSLMDNAESWLASAIAPLAQAEQAFSFVQGWLGNLVGICTNAISLTASAGNIIPAVSGELAGIVDALGTTLGGFPTTAAASVTSAIRSWSGASTPTVSAAVAPGGTLTPAPAADPRDVTTTLLSTLPSIVRLSAGPVAIGTASTSSAALGVQAAIEAGVTMSMNSIAYAYGAQSAQWGAGPAPAPALSAAVQAAVVAGAVQAATTISYTSQQDAQAMGAKLYAAIDQATGAAAALAASDPLNVTPVWRDLVALKGALAADLNAITGRLPAVVVINTSRAVPAWLLAQYAYGDTPSQIFNRWQDMIARNSVRNPAVVPPGAIELLNQ